MCAFRLSLTPENLLRLGSACQAGDGYDDDGDDDDHDDHDHDDDDYDDDGEFDSGEPSTLGISLPS